MACEQWRGKLDAYVDGELDPAEATRVGDASASVRSLRRGCAGTSTDEAIGADWPAIAMRPAPSCGIASRRPLSAKAMAPRPRDASRTGRFSRCPLLSLLILSRRRNFYVGRENARRQRVYSELADLHVAALASATPVDVVSTDRHTVKPWFQGKIPFSFNLPELQGSEFTLLGGRVTYLAQTPGAHLIYQIRKHEISVFIFQDRGRWGGDGEPAVGPVHALSFNVENWTQNGLRYFVVGDVSADDIQALSKLLRDCGIV